MRGSLLLRSYGFTRGPGQSTFVRQGDRTWLAHHYYDARDQGISRLQVRPVYWDDDGWPLAGEPIAEQTADRAAAQPEPIGRWSVTVNYGSRADEMVFDPDGSVRGSDATNVGRWAYQNNRLQIHWPDGRAASSIKDESFMSDDGRSFVGRRSTGSIIRGQR